MRFALWGAKRYKELKSPISPDLELWLGPIERMQGAGLKKIGVAARYVNVFGRLRVCGVL